MESTSMAILLIVLLLGMIFISHQYLVERQKREQYEHFQEERKDENLCLKPFSVTNNKEKTFRALIALEERIDELEYTLRKSGQRYEPMYKWYKLKVEKDSATAKAATDQLKAQMRNSINTQIEEAKQQYIKEQEAKRKADVEATQKAELETALGGKTTKDNKVAKEGLRGAFKEGNEDDRKELLDVMKKVKSPPAGYW